MGTLRGLCSEGLLAWTDFGCIASVNMQLSKAKVLGESYPGHYCIRSSSRCIRKEKGANDVKADCKQPQLCDISLVQ